MSLRKHAEEKNEGKVKGTLQIRSKPELYDSYKNIRKKNREVLTEVKAWGFTDKYHSSQDKLPFTY